MEVLEAYCNSLLHSPKTESSIDSPPPIKKTNSAALEQYKHEYFDEPQSLANKRASLRWQTQKRRSSRAQLLAGELNPIDQSQFENLPYSLAKKQKKALTINPTIPSKDISYGTIPTITAFLCNKGGTGKTTACINMASWLAAQGKKILVVDLDPQGSASTFTKDKNLTKPTTSADLFKKIILKDVQISKAFDNIDIIPANSKLLLTERDLQVSQESPLALKTQLLALARNAEIKYDHIFLDVPAGMGALSMSATVSSDNIVLPMDNSSYSESACSLLLELFKHVEKHTKKRPEIAMVLLRQQAGNFLEQILRDDRTRIKQLLSKYAPHDLNIVPIPYSSSCQRAARAQMTLKDFAPLDKLSRAFQKATTILQREYASKKAVKALQPMTEC